MKKIKTTFQLPAEMISDLDALAKTWGISRSATVVMLLREALKAHVKEFKDND